jgi:hypothetical protein
MKAVDQFHVGIVVDDFESTLAELSALFGYEWGEEVAVPTPATLPTGDAVLDMRFAYSMTSPRLEIIRTIPGTLWEPATGSGIHHLGYWSDDVAGDSEVLERRGFVFEAAGRPPDGAPHWSFYRAATGPRIEFVSRALQPAFERYWATGTFAS